MLKEEQQPRTLGVTGIHFTYNLFSSYDTAVTGTQEQIETIEEEQCDVFLSIGIEGWGKEGTC